MSDVFSRNMIDQNFFDSIAKKRGMELKPGTCAYCKKENIGGDWCSKECMEKWNKATAPTQAEYEIEDREHKKRDQHFMDTATKEQMRARTDKLKRAGTKFGGFSGGF